MDLIFLNFIHYRFLWLLYIGLSPLDPGGCTSICLRSTVQQLSVTKKHLLNIYSYSEAFALKLLENIEDILPWSCLYIQIFNHQPRVIISSSIGQHTIVWLIFWSCWRQWMNELNYRYNHYTYVLHKYVLWVIVYGPCPDSMGILNWRVV